MNKTTRAIALFVIAIVTLALFTACGSSPDPCANTANSNKAAKPANANSNSNSNSLTTSNVEVKGNEITFSINGTVTAPTEATKDAAESAANRRKSDAETAAYREEQRITTEAYQQSKPLREKATETFKQTDNPAYLKYLEYRDAGDYTLLEDLSKSSPAYRAFQASNDAVSKISADAKIKGEFEEAKMKFIALMVYTQEMELIKQKYDSAR